MRVELLVTFGESELDKSRALIEQLAKVVRDLDGNVMLRPEKPLEIDSITPETPLKDIFWPEKWQIKIRSYEDRSHNVSPLTLGKFVSLESYSFFTGRQSGGGYLSNEELDAACYVLMQIVEKRWPENGSIEIDKLPTINSYLRTDLKKLVGGKVITDPHIVTIPRSEELPTHRRRLHALCAFLHYLFNPDIKLTPVEVPRKIAKIKPDGIDLDPYYVERRELFKSSIRMSNINFGTSTWRALRFLPVQAKRLINFEKYPTLGALACEFSSAFAFPKETASNKKLRTELVIYLDVILRKLWKNGKPIRVDDLALDHRMKGRLKNYEIYDFKDPDDLNYIFKDTLMYASLTRCDVLLRVIDYLLNN